MSIFRWLRRSKRQTAFERQLLRRYGPHLWPARAILMPGSLSDRVWHSGDWCEYSITGVVEAAMRN